MQRSSGSAIVGLRSTSMAAAELQSEAGPTGEGVRGLALEAGFDEAGLVALPHEEEERDGLTIDLTYDAASTESWPDANGRVGCELSYDLFGKFEKFQFKRFGFLVGRNGIGHVNGVSWLNGAQRRLGEGNKEQKH